MLNLEIIPQWVIPLARVKNPEHAWIKDGLVRHSYEREQRSATPIASGIAPKFKSNLYESTLDLFKADVPEVRALAQFCTQALGSLVPATYFMRLVRGILLNGNEWADLWPNAWPMMLLTIVLMSVAVKFYRKTLD